MLSVVLDADAREQAARAVAWLSAPGSEPFARDTLVVPTLGLGLWLEQCVAAQAGVSAHLDIELPARFLWKQLADRVPGTAPRAPFDSTITRWAIHDALAHLPAHDAFSLLRERWQQAPDADRVLLAVRLARLYEQYQAYRRDWLTLWSDDRPVRFAGHGDARTEIWQRWLWRQILQRVRGLAERHPFDALRALPTPAAGRADAPAGGRIVLFGLFSLSPEQLEMLALLGREREMLWLAPDPAQGFWEDLVSPATAARLSAQAPQAAGLYPGEPAVLGEWGRQQRDFLVQLRRLETAGLLRIGDDDLRGRETAAPHSRLSALQQSVFLLADSPWDVLAQQHDFAGDASLEVHATHNLVRQVEVAHDRLLDAFAQMPDLRADQVAILCTDLESAAGLVRAVFEVDGATSLPVVVSGRSGRDDPAVRALLGFVALVEGRAGLSAVLEWLANDWLRERLRLDTDALAAVAEALQAAGVWRDDLAARDGGDQPGEVQPKHGWRRGIERLLLGLLVDPAPGSVGDQALQGVVADCWPMPAPDRDQLQVLEQLLLLLDDVRRWRQQVSDSPVCPVGDWAAALIEWADRWLGGADGQHEGPFRIRDAIAQLTSAFEALDAPQSQTLSFAAFAEGLRQALAESDPAARSQGAITVAPLGSLTGIAYRVVVILGLDEGAWPPRQAQAEFDLTGANPRQGDRRGADVARGVFLQTLLDTTDRVLLCHTGRDPRDDSERQPARIVVELLDALQAQATRTGCAAIADVRHVHPLQPFSPRRFLASPPSHARAWHAAARHLGDPTRTPLRQGPVTAAVSGAVAMPSQLRLEQLVDGLVRPQRAYRAAACRCRSPGRKKQSMPTSHWSRPISGAGG
ncbi:MAG: exodeoxyribonuclease V subunit gamma [Burkholderiaceae bacterium]